MIEVSYKGHYKGCVVVGLLNEIKYYESLLNKGINDANDDARNVEDL